MARNKLDLTRYEAETVIMPLGGEKVAEVVRVTVFGPVFPQRAVEPELLIGEMRAQRVSIARDQRSIRGYFIQVPHEGDAIRVRYGDSQEGVVSDPFLRDRIRPLEKDC